MVNRLLREQVNVELIVINWIKMEIDEIKKLDSSKDFGLYQAYGNHYAYGKNVLLYIGKAEKNTFASRVDEVRIYDSFIETTVEPELFRIGYISSSENLTNLSAEEIASWEESICLAEDILISTHTPAMNSQLNFGLGKIGSKYDSKPIIILNQGNRGALLPEVSTLRNTYKYYDHTIHIRQE